MIDRSTCRSHTSLDANHKCFRNDLTGFFVRYWHFQISNIYLFIYWFNLFFIGFIYSFSLTRTWQHPSNNLQHFTWFDSISDFISSHHFHWKFYKYIHINISRLHIYTYTHTYVHIQMLFIYFLILYLFSQLPYRGPFSVFNERQTR